MSAAIERSNVIPVTGYTPSPHDDRSIGTLLIQAGRLHFEIAEEIAQYQRKNGLRFGDAAVQLGLVSSADIDLALARQFDYPYLMRGKSPVSEHVVAAYAPFGKQAATISALRGQLMLRWFESVAEGRALAIMSPDRGEGRSFIAANLAVACSQLGKKTLLIDADMRHPNQHVMFGIDNHRGLSTMLSNRAETETVIQRIPGLLGLSVIPAGALPPNPLELLARTRFPQLLADLAFHFEVILIDSPPATQYNDGQCIASRAGAALIITRKGKTRLSHVFDAAEMVSDAGAQVVGTVLNDF